jgi:FKBP-type peptidyl-prolyl cis-trans isomerase 2
MEVGHQTVVTLRYTMKNESGEVLENIMTTTGVEYLHGAGSIIPELEKGLEGMHEGETRSMTIRANSGNHSSPVFYFDVVVDKVRPANETELSAGKPNKEMVEKDCGPGCCC